MGGQGGHGVGPDPRDVALFGHPGDSARARPGDIWVAPDGGLWAYLPRQFAGAGRTDEQGIGDGWPWVSLAGLRTPAGRVRHARGEIPEGMRLLVRDGRAVAR